VNDREKFIGMLAAANFRYSIVVADLGCFIVTNGKRDQRPGSASQLTFKFTNFGQLEDIKVDFQ